jgi:hypothetical protein
MPTRTVYVKESDLPMWDRAVKELGNVSQVVGDCIKNALERKMSTQTVEKMEKIVLDFWDNDSDYSPTVKKSFMGRWLIQDVRAEDDNTSISWDAGTEYSVAQSKTGKIVAYITHCHQGFKPSYDTYDSFDHFKDATDGSGQCPVFPSNVIALTAAALGEPYEIELDI